MYLKTSLSIQRQTIKKANNWDGSAVPTLKTLGAQQRGISLHLSAARTGTLFRVSR